MIKEEPSTGLVCSAWNLGVALHPSLSLAVPTSCSRMGSCKSCWWWLSWVLFCRQVKESAPACRCREDSSSHGPLPTSQSSREKCRARPLRRSQQCPESLLHCLMDNWQEDLGTQEILNSSSGMVLSTPCIYSWPVLIPSYLNTKWVERRTLCFVATQQLFNRRHQHNGE